jgi:SprT-like family
MKKLFCSLALIAIVLFTGSFAPPKNSVHAKDYPSEPFVSEQRANEFYKAYNNEYFEGRLPAATVRFEKNLIDTRNGQRAYGMTYFGNPSSIYLEAQFQNEPVITYESEIHEMCHVAVDGSAKGPEFDDHGPRWQLCMTRVAEQGGFEGIW